MTSLRLHKVSCGGLRLRETSIPPYKLRGETAELRCDFEPEDSPIYSVKWFKDDEEFYRYVPRDEPSYQIFPRVGLSVDMDLSKPSQVVLQRVEFNASGQYRCEVSAEGPDFNTVIAQGRMIVVGEFKGDSRVIQEPPTSGPVITGGRKTYRVNDTVELMCTSSPSRPPAHLSWRINGRPAPQEHVTKERPYLAHDGLLTQISRLIFVARPYHFQGGNLEVKCVAEISEHHLKHHKAIPKNFRPWERSFQVLRQSSEASIRSHPISARSAREKQCEQIGAR
ncbi:uncharacterized protein LOC122258437 [Penaeus japonicus]|uniref:uncharacterized protein LOC122258437 n=1 Tax=Penaeus japonicus TaxID=27405 RepID=UPI001C711782|nr:uncharacterized protein LOC122258437 [Penaeus japonicus]